MDRSEFVISYWLGTPPSFREKAHSLLLTESGNCAGLFNRRFDENQPSPVLCAGYKYVATSPVRRHILADIHVRVKLPVRLNRPYITPMRGQLIESLCPEMNFPPLLILPEATAAREQF
jgi:hypothetical protein